MADREFIACEPLRRGHDDVLVFEPLLELWDASWIGTDLPVRSSFPPEVLVGYGGWTSVAEEMDSGKDFAYRLFGSKAAARLGEEYNWRRLSEIEPHSYQVELIRQFNEILDGGVPTLSRMRNFYAGKGHSYFRVALPVMKEPGGVRQIITVLRFIDDNPADHTGFKTMPARR